MKPILHSKHQTGVTLLEVLVAIAVLSFGLFGLLGLLTNGLKMTSSSQYRTIAAQQLTMMADMINANPDIRDKYRSPTATNNASTCMAAAGCTTANFANNDYNLWQQNLAALLPSGKGIVCLDSTPGDGNSAGFLCSGTGRLTVKICWNENARIAISKGGVSGTDASTDTCLSEQL